MALTRQPVGRPRRWTNFAATAAAVAATALAGIAVGWRSWRSRPTWEPIPREARTYALGRSVIGDSSNRVVVVMFSDFNCEYCRRAAEDLNNLQERRPDQIAVVLLHRPVRPHSWPAAIAAICASRQGVVKPIQELLFANAKEFEMEPWAKIAAMAGVRDLGRFRSCLVDGTAAQEVRRDILVGDSLGVQATPTILIGWRRYTGNPGLRRLDGLASKVDLPRFRGHLVKPHTPAARGIPRSPLG